MSNNQKDESPLRGKEVDQKSPKEDRSEADSKTLEQEPTISRRRGDRPDLEWTDHED